MAHRRVTDRPKCQVHDDDMRRIVYDVSWVMEVAVLCHGHMTAQDNDYLLAQHARGEGYAKFDDGSFLLRTQEWDNKNLSPRLRFNLKRMRRASFMVVRIGDILSDPIPGLRYADDW